MLKDKITTVPELVEALYSNKSSFCFLDIMKRVDISKPAYERYYTWSDDHYTRNCIAKSKEFELLLVCWEKGQFSPIHDFDSHAAWIHTIHGKLREERYRIRPDRKGVEKMSSVSLDELDFSYIGGKVGIHSYKNIYESRSISLILYVGPLEKWKEYELNSPETREVTVTHDSFHEMQLA